jgi:hypothetical protein
MTQKPRLWEKLAFKVFAVLVNSPTLWRIATTAGGWFQPLHRIVFGGPLDPARAWTRTRDLPPVARQTFKGWWRTRP